VLALGALDLHRGVRDPVAHGRAAEAEVYADVDAGLAYRWRNGAELEAGYHFTYFFQHEHSHEDDNRFELIDNGARVRFVWRF